MSNKEKKPTVLVILDGWGEWDIEKGNAIAGAKLTTIEELNQNYPKLVLQASGLSVGLPWGVMGNSEVGHQTIGTGQIIFQYLASIDMAIHSGDFLKNETLLEVFETAKKNKSNLHFVGLVSDGAVHSHINHLAALLSAAKENKVPEVFVHAITDGRDVSPFSAKKYIGNIERMMKAEETGKLATISGRYFAMDRNNNWDRTEKAYKAMVEGGGIHEKVCDEAIDKAYEKKIATDEYIEPINLVDEKNEPIGLIKKGDVVLCFNFRKDRSRQISKVFCCDDFKEFNAKKLGVNYYAFTQYEKTLPLKVIFPEQEITARLGEIVSKAGKKQLRIAETEKYAHVTFFFNGGNEAPFSGEDRILIPSKNATTYADLPEMSADEVTKKVIEAIDSKKYDFILLNFANPDMVGHTGDYKAAKKAVEVVDECLGRVVKKILENNGQAVITADHGNVEEMINLTTYEKDTEHSTNPVPCWLVSKDYKRKKPIKEKQAYDIQGMIVDIPPTILELLDLEKDKGMVGMSLLKNFKKQIK